MIDATERWEVSECTAKADANYVEFQIRKRGDDSLGAIIGFTAELPVHERELAEERAKLLAAAPAMFQALRVFVEKYRNAPDGERFGVGLVNGDFLNAEDVLKQLEPRR